MTLVTPLNVMPPIVQEKIKLSKTKISFTIIVFLLVAGGILYPAPLIQAWVWATSPTFSVIVLPDTQKYSKSYPRTFCAQTQWIVDNEKERNIIFMAHMGDIVDSGKFSKDEWVTASNCLGLMDGKVPYSVIPGNHDTETNNRDSGTATYDSYFPVSRFSQYPWYKGNRKENANNYQIIKKYGVEFLFLNLEIEPSDNTLAWANDVIKQHPNTYTIVSTHKYLPDNDTGRDTERSYSATGNTGQQIWEKLIQPNCSIKMVWSGHYHKIDGEFMMNDRNKCGDQVPQIIQDYQERAEGGGGRLRIYTFDVKNKSIGVETFSPTTNTFETDSDSKFIIPFNY